MIKYVVKSLKNVVTGSTKYYAQVAPVSPLTLDDITEKISGECTVTEHDVKAVLSALQEQVIAALRDGNSVRLGDLGSFRLTLSSSGEENRNDVSADNITALRVRFTMSARMRSTLAKGQRGISFGRWGTAGTTDEEEQDAAQE